jgi:hypothetical protein
MDDGRQNSSTFIDEDIDFDTLLEDDDFQAEQPRRASIPGMSSTKPVKRYRPTRLRVTPNWSRIAVAVLVGAVVLFVLGWGVKAWLDHRTASAYKDYMQQVDELVNRSDAQGEEVVTLLATLGRRSPAVHRSPRKDPDPLPRPGQRRRTARRA